MHNPIIKVIKNHEVYKFNDIEELPVLIYTALMRVFNDEKILKITVAYDDVIGAMFGICVVTADNDILTKWSCVPETFSAINDIKNWEVDAIW